MGRFDKKEPKLNEVKAVLQRLQGFPEDPAPPPAAEKASAPAPPRRGGMIAVIILLPAAAIIGAAMLFSSLLTSEPGPEAGPTIVAAPKFERTEAVKAALEAARGLMAKGQVRAAREQLLALAVRGSPDAAWDVARSFDPNVLATIPQADAAPDIAEATRWYRTWYDSAVKEGMVANSVSIERIITSMQNAPSRAPK
jgi:hypothetical protein